MKTLIDPRKLEKEREVEEETQEKTVIQEERDQEIEIETPGVVGMKITTIEIKKGQKKGLEKDQEKDIVGIGIALETKAETNPEKEKGTQVVAARKKKVVTVVGCLLKSHSGKTGFLSIVLNDTPA